MQLPVVDVQPLREADPRAARHVATSLTEACEAHGFFLVEGHGVDMEAVRQLEQLAREFFALEDEEKQRIAMERGGRAWRGWFPYQGELTSGRPDGKEGIYFGTELPPDDRPMHGPNLFPERPAELRSAVLAHLEAMEDLGRLLVGGLDLALGVGGRLVRLVGDPLCLFRIFRYLPAETKGVPGAEGGDDEPQWGVGEHSDYGLLTILHQDETGGLEVQGPRGWTEVPPRPGAFVCNIGDMLERATNGRFRSTLHRVRRPEAERISMPYFFDPGWDAEVEPLVDGPGGGTDRWDGTDPHLFGGPYGDYVWQKVGKVFPGLG